MSKKRIEKYIKEVMPILKEEFSNGVIPKEFNGYIASFGASIVMSGLKSTIALFENKQASTAQDRSYLTKIILKLLQSDEKDDSEKTLLEYVLNSDQNEMILKEKIKDAAIAIKLAIRTFKLEKGLTDVSC